jgi:hypothetical protein
MFPREAAMTFELVKPETSSDLAKVSASRRAELAQTYLSEPAVQTLLGIDATSLEAMRDEKGVLGVWHEPANAWIYPDFQFDKSGLIEQMPRLLAVYDRYYSHVWKNTWSIVEWFLSPHVLLDGCRPMDVMATNPQRVLRAAQVEFWEDPATF